MKRGRGTKNESRPSAFFFLLIGDVYFFIYFLHLISCFVINVEIVETELVWRLTPFDPGSDEEDTREDETRISLVDVRHRRAMFTLTVPSVCCYV